MNSDTHDKPHKPYQEEDLNNEKITGNFSKLNVYNWLHKKPLGHIPHDIVEVKFKNTRKGFYVNASNLKLNIGDYVAVEGMPGHDIGIVALTGSLMYEQMKKKNCSNVLELKKIYRKAKESDMEKWREAIALEYPTMLEARRLTRDLNLNMKIGDVEYQGDKMKAIFYYISDERIDFRQLLKIMADQFKVRIEMRQIGARQEAGRIGSLGACGRELCCSTWMNNFVSVATNAARVQELSLNPQKLAGQCSKLKCCLNYELDCYLDARQGLPGANIQLKTKEGIAVCQKTDIYKKQMWYAISGKDSNQLIQLSVEKVWQIIEQNKKGIIPEKLESDENTQSPEKNNKEVLDYQNVVGQESIDRFRKQNKKKKQNKNKNSD